MHTGTYVHAHHIVKFLLRMGNKGTHHYTQNEDSSIEAAFVHYSFFDNWVEGLCMMHLHFIPIAVE